MDNITFITDDYGNDHAIIENADGSFTSMPKAVYDEQQAKQASGTISQDCS